MDQDQSRFQKERLRPPPGGRFSGASHLFDLNEVIRRLREEPHDGRSGHRQVTIFRYEAVTQVVFAFDEAGELADHAANGLVTIQVLEGRFEVQAEGQAYDAVVGQILILRPQVRHSVRALLPGALLLTIHLEGHHQAGPSD